MMYLRLATKGDSPGIYHSDPDCMRLPERHREVDADHVKRRDLRECRVCAGRVEQPEERFRSLRTRIEQGEVEV